jgi:hypothetical protein
VYKTVSGTLQQWGNWKKEQLLKIIEGYKPKNIYNADETGLSFRLLPNKILSLKGDPCSGVRNSMEKIMILLACNAIGTDQLPTLVTWQ